MTLTMKMTLTVATDDDDDGDDPKDSLVAHDHDIFAEAAAFTAVLVNSSSRGRFWGAVVGFSMLQHCRCLGF